MLPLIAMSLPGCALSSAISFAAFEPSISTELFHVTSLSVLDTTYLRTLLMYPAKGSSVSLLSGQYSDHCSYWCRPISIASHDDMTAPMVAPTSGVKYFIDHSPGSWTTPSTEMNSPAMI